MRGNRRWGCVVAAVVTITASIAPAAADVSAPQRSEHSGSTDTSADTAPSADVALLDAFGSVLPEGLPSGADPAPPVGTALPAGTAVPADRQAGGSSPPPHVVATLPSQSGTDIVAGVDAFYVVEREDIAVGDAIRIRRVGRNGRVLAERRIDTAQGRLRVDGGVVLLSTGTALIELDPVTLATIRDHSIAEAWQVAAIGSELWAPQSSFGWTIIDRSTGAQRNGTGPDPRGEVHHTPALGDRILYHWAGTLMLLEKVGDDLVTVASVPGIDRVVLGRDGTILTSSSSRSAIEVRSADDLAVVSSTQVPGRSVVGWAEDVAAAIVHLAPDATSANRYELWPIGADRPASTVNGTAIHAVLPDGLFAGVGLRVGPDSRFEVWLGTFAPRIGSSDVAVFDRAVVDRIGLDGDGLVGVTSVRANGAAVPFSNRSGGHLEIDVSSIGPAGDVELVVDGPLGSDTIVVPGRARQGMIPLSIRFTAQDSGPATIGYSVRCGRDDRPVRRVAARGRTVVVQVPAYVTCVVDIETGRRVLGGYRDPAQIQPTVDVFGRRASIVTTGPVHLDFLIGAPVGTRPLWVFTTGRGDAPTSAAYRIGVRCGTWRRVLTVRGGSAGRFAVPDGSSTCEATVVGRAGARSVRIVRVDALEQELEVSESGSISVGAGRQLDGVYLIMGFDHGGTDLVAPIAVGAPGVVVGGRADAGSVVLHETDGRGSPHPTRRLVLRRGDVLAGRPQAGERLGESVALGDFDGDGHLDVALGAPGARVAGRVGAGVVEVVSAVATRQRRTVTLHHAMPGLDGGTSGGTGFGSALAVLDHDADGFDDLAVGVPGGSSGGEVILIHGGSDGLDTGRVGHLTRRDLDGGSPSAGDTVGSVLDGDDGWLVIGAPDARVAGRARVGLAAVLQPNGSVIALVPRGRTPGDRFGAAVGIDVPRVVVGAPTHRSSGIGRSGALFLFDADRPRGEVFSNLRDGGADGFRFGAALLVMAEPLVMVAGVPGAVIPGVRGEGAIFAEDGLDVLGLIAGADAGASRGPAPVAFGASLASGIRGQVMVGAPGDARTPGSVHVLDGSGDWVVLRAPSSRRGDEFGSALAG